MNLKGKILISFIIVITLFMILIAITNLKFVSSSEEYTDMITSSNEKVATITELLISIQQKQVSIRNYIIKPASEELQTIKEANRIIEEQLTTLYQILAEQDDVEIVKEMAALNEQYNGVLDVIIGAVNNGNTEKASNHLVETFSVTSSLINDAERILNSQQEKMSVRTFDMESEAKDTVLIISIFVLFVILVSFSIALTMSRIIAKKATLIQQASAAMAAGNLTAIIPEAPNAKDELDCSLHHFSEMQKQLQQTMRDVMLTAEQVARASEELLASSDESAAAADQVANAVADSAQQASEQNVAMKTSANDVTKLRNHLDSVADGAREVRMISTENLASVVDGQQQIEKMQMQMNSLLHANSETNDVMVALNKQANDISAIVTTITAVADQTNLLSLNAAIEAARAGEYGKGFAVVADEVRKLAEQSKHSADEITGIIQTIQADTTRAVKFVERGTKEVEQSVALTNEANEVFTKIHTSVEKSSTMINELTNVTIEIGNIATGVSSSIEQVSVQSTHISKNVEGVAAISEEQQASAEEIAASASTLANSSEQLLQAVTKFKI